MPKPNQDNRNSRDDQYDANTIGYCNNVTPTNEEGEHNANATTTNEGQPCGQSRTLVTTTTMTAAALFHPLPASTFILLYTHVRIAYMYHHCLEISLY